MALGAQQIDVLRMMLKKGLGSDSHRNDGRIGREPCHDAFNGQPNLWCLSDGPVDIFRRRSSHSLCWFNSMSVPSS